MHSERRKCEGTQGKESHVRDFLVGQWLRLHTSSASTAGGASSIPGLGTKIPHAMVWQKNKEKKRKPCNWSDGTYKPRDKKDCCKHQMPEEARQDSPLELPERAQLCQHLNF